MAGPEETQPPNQIAANNSNIDDVFTVGVIDGSAG